jgi:hypothetical protein
VMDVRVGAALPVASGITLSSALIGSLARF